MATSDATARTAPAAAAPRGAGRIGIRHGLAVACLAFGVAHLLRTSWYIEVSGEHYSFRTWLWQEAPQHSDAVVSSSYGDSLLLGGGWLLLGVVQWRVLGGRRKSRRHG